MDLINGRLVVCFFGWQAGVDCLIECCVANTGIGTLQRSCKIGMCVIRFSVCQLSSCCLRDNDDDDNDDDNDDDDDGFGNNDNDDDDEDDDNDDDNGNCHGEDY